MAYERGLGLFILGSNSRDWTDFQMNDLDKMAVEELLDALQQGHVRAASRGDDGVWRANPAVKQGILQAFRVGTLTASEAGCLTFVDKDNLLPQRFPPPCVGLHPTVTTDSKHSERLQSVASKGACPPPCGGLHPPVPMESRRCERAWSLANKGACPRIVPGGTAVRRGAYLAQGVVVMPPAYINIGAYVDEGSLVDSHALVGSCAQVGKRVHLSAAVQLGGVLEPVGALPVIVEDNVFVGGGVGIYEGTVVRRGAVIGTGVQLTASAKIYDLARERMIVASSAGVLEIPERAVVLAGARPARGEFAREHGIAVATPVIVKYRDERTDAKTALEDALRAFVA